MDKVNPYHKPIEDIRGILKTLFDRMVDPQLDMKIFRNMMAIYVMWQEDLHLAQVAAMNWDIEHEKSKF